MIGWARVRSLLATAGPSVGVEIAPRRVTAVAVEPDGPGFMVAAHATVPLPEGAVVPALNATNLPDAGPVVEALRQALAGLGRRVRRVGLVVPDAIAKVALVRFETVPSRAQDLDQLVRWQVRKTAPFRLEEAQVAYTPGMPAAEGGREFIVTLARREIVQEYERVCAAAGAYAGLVDLASFNLVNAVLAAGGQAAPSDWLLVHVTPAYATMAILRGAHLRFFRNRPADGEGDLADLVHQTAMYYEDRLGGARFARVVAAGLEETGEAEATRRQLEQRLGTPVEPIDPRPAAALRDRIEASAAMLSALAAPVGLLLRDRVAGRERRGRA